MLVPLTLATAGILGLSLWRRAAPLGVPIPSIDVPQGKIIKCTFTFKNTGSIRAKFQAYFEMQDRGGISMSIPGVELDPGASVTKDIYLGIPTDWPVGTYWVKLHITDVLADGTPNYDKIYDTSTGTAKVISGVAASITAVSLSIV